MHRRRGQRAQHLQSCKPTSVVGQLQQRGTGSRRRGERRKVYDHNTSQGARRRLLRGLFLCLFQMFLFLSGQTGQISAGSATNEPTSLTLGLSALSVVLFWMLLPHISVCAVICLGWMAQRQIQRMLQSQKSSS